MKIIIAGGRDLPINRYCIRRVTEILMRIDKVTPIKYTISGACGLTEEDEIRYARGSSRIACYDMGFDFTGYELDQDYWKAQEERYKTHISQGRIFKPEEIQDCYIERELF